MIRFVGLCFPKLVRFFHGRRSLLLENLALRQQVVALKRRHPRPSLGHLDKLFWVVARRVWSDWKQSLILVTPETVARWLCLAKTSYTRRMNDLRKTEFTLFRYNSCHDCVASTFPGLVGQHFPFPGGPRPLRTWLSVGNCSLCTRNGLALD